MANQPRIPDSEEPEFEGVAHASLSPGQFTMAAASFVAIFWIAHLLYDGISSGWEYLHTDSLLATARGRTPGRMVTTPDLVRLSPPGVDGTYYVDKSTRTCFIVYDLYGDNRWVAPIECTKISIEDAPDGPDASDSDNP